VKEKECVDAVMLRRARGVDSFHYTESMERKQLGKWQGNEKKNPKKTEK